jgi:hypothetical protein
MRPLKFLTDLPWWTGLPIFLVGTAAVLFFYPLGIIVALFGAWTFYKLMEPDDYKLPGFDLIGFPLKALHFPTVTGGQRRSSKFLENSASKVFDRKSE